MSAPTEYDVAREHLGDKKYHRGDTRTMPSGDAAGLLGMGVLREKAAAPLQNKMDAVPANKSTTTRKRV